MWKSLDRDVAAIDDALDSAADVDATETMQVVSELGEMGHREGEALTKIDSIGFQLANLLDPNMSFDVSEHSLFAFARPISAVDRSV